MAEQKMWYDDIRLKVAENGFILSYSEVSKRKTSGSNDWENTTRNYKEKVYEFSNNGDAIKEMVRMGSIKNKNLAKYAKGLEEKSVT